MDNETLHIETLDLIVAPCFCVKAGRIFQCNAAAKHLPLPLGAEIAPLLATGQEEYTAYEGGSLYLTLDLSGTVFGAEVERRGELDFFVLEGPAELRELRALSLAAAELRLPLSGILASAAALANLAGEDGSQQAASLSRGLAQVLRLVGNMSAASSGTSHQALVEITGIFREIFEKAGAMLEGIGLCLDYRGPETALYCLVDTQELERAVLNLLSNAAKFTPRGGHIAASLTRQGRMLRLCIQDAQETGDERIPRADRREDGNGHRFGAQQSALCRKQRSPDIHRDEHNAHALPDEPGGFRGDGLLC